MSGPSNARASRGCARAQAKAARCCGFPARFVEQHQQSRFERHLAGQIDIHRAIVWIAKGDFSHPQAAPVGDPSIGGDALIDGLGEINNPLRLDGQAQAGLPGAERRTGLGSL